MSDNHATDTFRWGLWDSGSERAEQFIRELEEMQLVDDFTTGGGYDWSTFVSYYHPGSDRFYYVSGSGCSCNSISDGISRLSDFQSVRTLRELERAFRAEAKFREYDSDWSEAEVSSAVGRILNWRPKTINEKENN